MKLQKRSEKSGVKLTKESAGLYSNKIRSEIQYAVHTHAPGVVHTYVARLTQVCASYTDGVKS